MARRIFALSLAVLALMASAGGAGAAPPTRSAIKAKPAAARSCQTIQVAKWECRNGQQPGDVFRPGNSCRILLVPQTVCPKA